MLIHFDSLSGFIDLYCISSKIDTGQTVGVLVTYSQSTGILAYLFLSMCAGSRLNDSSSAGSPGLSWRRVIK